MKNQKISTELLEYVETDDVVGARRLLEGANGQDRKSIVGNTDYNGNAPLLVAAMRGNVDMVAFLAKECHADKEVLGRYKNTYAGGKGGLVFYLVTPLWCAAASNKLEVVKLLIDLGADINAASGTGGTPVLYACDVMNVDVVNCLIKHGADVKKPDNCGRTCLMIVIRRAVNNYNSDNYKEIEDMVQLLIDHGADPYLKDHDDYDAFQMSSHFGLESILQKLLLRFQPSTRLWIESFKLIGTHFTHSNNAKAFSYWKRAIELREINSYSHMEFFQSNPVYLYAKELNTVEELEMLFQNQDFVYMHALMVREQILGPNHPSLQSELFNCSERYKIVGEFRRSFEILRYAYQQQNACVEQMTNPYHCFLFIRPLYKLCLYFIEMYNECHQPNSRNNFRIHFEDVFEILLMATSKIDATGIMYSLEFQYDAYCSLFFMKSLLYLIKLLTEIDKNEDDKLRFNKVIYRLVRCQPKTDKGQTLLHLSVEQSTLEFDEDFYWQLSNITVVVGLLLECGTNVNAVDVEHNTALHVCSKAIQNLQIKQHHDLIKQIAVLLLKHGAHPDMVNHSGDSAMNGLRSSLTEMNIADLISLKCSAASALMKYNISYVEHIPFELESFCTNAWNMYIEKRAAGINNYI